MRHESPAGSGDRPAVSAVHFDAGGRTRPHVHRSGQVLQVTAGEGIVAEVGSPWPVSGCCTAE